MGPRFRMLLSVVVVLVATGLLVPASVAGQSADDGWTLPRTPDGHPDLGGVWANNSATPLERPEVWADKERLTDEELAALLVASDAAVGDGDALFGDQLVLAAIAGIEATSYDPTTGNYNQFWIAERDFDNRTSLVIDPPAGRIPDLTPEAQERRPTHTPTGRCRNVVSATACRDWAPATTATIRYSRAPTTWSS